MRNKAFITYLFITLLLISITAIINAEQEKYGSIKGILTDNKTGDPVIGVSVIIEGTTLGAITDFDGKYFIEKVPPGIYNLKITSLHYKSDIIKQVTVIVDVTTEVSFKLTKAENELDSEISVTAEKPKLLRDLTTTEVQQTLSFDCAIAAPDISKVDKKLHIRGGRANDVGYATGIHYPAHGGTAIVNDEPFDAMFFKNYGVNPFVDTEDDHLSTFAVDVDDASYVMMRSYLNRGALPPDEAIRTEEFVNHFNYNYAPPYEQAFRVYVEGAPSRFGQNCSMLKIGIKGMEIAPENRKDANLVFVIDVSGSMATENRLGLVKQALRLLVDELSNNDNVGIVVYGSTGRVILEPTSLRNKQKIVRAIESLHSGGATNAEEGIVLGYEMAKRNYQKGKINRVILCSDGVANVGRTGPDALLKQIKSYADMGITLSTVGFGMTNYNDILMEKLGDKGNGHYAYVDNLAEAKKIFVDNLTGNLQVIARDVKIQVDFNPDVIRSYRLIGYENRDVEDNKFRDDTEDGGEIGAGHQVTALYEIKFKEGAKARRLGTIFIRYKDPETHEVTEINQSITTRNIFSSFDHASYDFKLAATAAEFAEILRKSYWAKGSKLDDVLSLAKDLTQESSSADVIELMSLISKAQQFDEQLASE